MRQEFDREFDALLRRAAARAAARGDESESVAAAPHLDADELSAFAEGSLPEAARAASVSHLADCAACRRVVANLASASGMSLRLEKSEAVAASAVEAARASESEGWRAWLSALFAPRFLRYAAPALALCVVGVVSFVALRSSDREEMSARSAAGTSAPAGAAMNANAASANMNSSVAEVGQAATANANLSAPDAGAPGAAKADSPAAADKLAARASDDKSGRADTPSTAGQQSGASEAVSVTPVEGPRLASSPAAPAPAPLQVAESRAEPKREADAAARDNAYSAEPSEQERARSANQIRGAENQQAPDGSRNQQRSAVNNRSVQNLGGGAAPPPPAREAAKEKSQPPASGQAPGRGVADATTADGGSSATRSVEGRRFRRQGGVWVDVNFRESLPSVGVRRGTEAYRALVAELPEVGRVAEALAGEVVVVARGRAYRIK